MLNQFGVDVKASKSAVLSEATDYIAHLQRQHAHSEAERARMLQLLHAANRGATLPASDGVGGPGAGGGGGGVATAPPQIPGVAAQKPSPAVAVVAAAPGRTVKHPPSGAYTTLSHGNLATAVGAAPTTSPTSGAFDFVGGEAAPDAWLRGGVLSDGAGGVSSPSLRQAQQPPPPPPPPSTGPEDSVGSVPGVMGNGIGTTVAAAGQATNSAASDVPGFPGLSSTARSPEASTTHIPGVMTPGMSSAIPGAVTMGTAPVVGGGTGASGAPLEATARVLSHVNYERVFRTATIPMAIANVNGNLVDCNTRLTQVTGFGRDEALFMTIFDLVADPFLQHTFRLVRIITTSRILIIIRPVTQGVT